MINSVYACIILFYLQRLCALIRSTQRISFFLHLISSRGPFPHRIIHGNANRQVVAHATHSVKWGRGIGRWLIGRFFRDSDAGAVVGAAGKDVVTYRRLGGVFLVKVDAHLFVFEILDFSTSGVSGR